MTDDEILGAAERIRRRRLNEARLKSFEEKETVAIRWDNSLRWDQIAAGAENFTSITVPASAVADIVRFHFNTLIAEGASTNPSAPR